MLTDCENENWLSIVKIMLYWSIHPNVSFCHSGIGAKKTFYSFCVMIR
ncbi:hypothetical protein FH063_004754 [Azospirillum argentinense]|uniref:Uncharacterized protein n=1 Tax=Azospirillum argentinense TaxID=2970906 RepID=A0A5B0KKW0_9PROT|nr:hypothetical protein FH063_004754 [Azospirillum argentinense]